MTLRRAARSFKLRVSGRFALSLRASRSSECLIPTLRWAALHRRPIKTDAPFTRRAVLKSGLAGILAYGVAPNIFPSSLFGRNAPSNRITLAMIGNGLICGAHVSTLTGRDDCQILA